MGTGYQMAGGSGAMFRFITKNSVLSRAADELNSLHFTLFGKAEGYDCLQTKARQRSILFFFKHMRLNRLLLGFSLVAISAYTSHC